MPARRVPSSQKRTAAPAPSGSPGPLCKATIAAGPKPGHSRKTKPEPSHLDRLQKVIIRSLDDDKAENIVTLDLAGKSMFCDRMVIATGLVDRQITAMAQHLAERLKEIGLGRVDIEGAGGSDWVLIDAGDVIVHLFKPEARAMYALEKMWGEDLDEAL